MVLRKKKLSLSQICNELCQHYKHRNDLQLTYHIENEIIILGDKVSLHSIISNLLENAIKYTENGIVNLNLCKKDDTCVLEVSDEGKGINNADKKKVFTKFYRIGNEETRSAKGTGLGLYIVQQLVNFHKGRIWIEDNEPKGAKFLIEFPI